MLLSVEDLQARVVASNGVYPDEVNLDLLHEAECLSYLVVLPKDFNKRTQYLGNLLAQMCLAHKGELRMDLGRIAAALSYLLNSTSFREGKYHDYDKQEIKRKLRGLTTEAAPEGEEEMKR